MSSAKGARSLPCEGVEGRAFLRDSGEVLSTTTEKDGEAEGATRGWAAFGVAGQNGLNHTTDHAYRANQR